MTARRWSTRQVTDLAPDARSVAAARKLATPATWSQLGCTPALVWGRCQGSASQPYQVTVDLAGPEFRCTCPSRKLPCKHGLALLLLWVEHGDAVGEVASAPDAAGQWAGRRARQRAAGGGDGAGATEVADPEAQARREAQRVEKMGAGFEELQRWLADLVRQGLAAARRQPYGFWDAMAARLVDAQLPGLAERVRAMGGALLVRADWADHLLAECGRWQLAAHAWQRREALPAALLGDLRAFVGWPWRADEEAAFPTLADHWVVAGVRQGDDGRIVSQRTWVWGRRSQRWAVVLDFAASAGALRVAHVVGSVVDDAVQLHPGSDPPRAAFSGGQRVVGSGAAPHAVTVPQAVDGLATALSANPWRDHLPVAVRDVVLVEDAGRWWLRDTTDPAAGARLPLAPGSDPWLPLALSGGRPATVVAEWQDGAVHPMTVLAGTPVPL